MCGMHMMEVQPSVLMVSNNATIILSSERCELLELSDMLPSSKRLMLLPPWSRSLALRSSTE